MEFHLQRLWFGMESFDRGGLGNRFWFGVIGKVFGGERTGGIILERQRDRKTKRQKDRKTKRQKDKKTKRQRCT